MSSDIKLYNSKKVLLLTGLIIACLCTSRAYAQNIENVAKAKPFDIKGNLSATGIFFNINGRESYREPFSWLLRGSPTIYLYGIAIPVTIIVSEQERDFRQPFNRFGISPEYKWAKVYLGYQNLQYSKYSLAGHSIVGAGVDLNPGKLRFSYMHGRLLRAIQSSPFIDNQDFRVISAFKRTGDIVKIGYGTDENFVDFITLKGKDDLSSLDSIPDNMRPAENLVTALVTNQTIFKKIQLQLDYAESYYTEDIRAEETLNKEVLPVFRPLITEKTSTQKSTAIHANVQYIGNIFYGGVEYERIDPDYKSMGAYFFLNDIQRITINPGVKVFDKKINIRTSFGYQENNLAETKASRTIRKVAGLFVNARIGKIYQFSGNYSNFGVEQKQTFEVQDPGTAIAQVTQQWSMNHVLSFNNENHFHNINLNINQQSLNDDNEFTKSFSDYTSSTYTGNYMVTFLRSHFTVHAGFTHSSFALTEDDINYYGPTLGLNKAFSNNKWQVALNANYFINQESAKKIREITRLTLRTSYRVSKNQKISLRGQFGKNEFNEEKDRSYDETKFEISYGYRF